MALTEVPRLMNATTTRCLLGTILAALFLIGLPQLQAAALNDTCAAAEIIPGAGPFPHWTTTRDITLATAVGDPPAPTCYLFDLPSLNRSVWYSFTPSRTSLYTISACSDAPTATTVGDTIMAIYSSGSCANPGALVEVAGGCSDDRCGPLGLQSATTLALQAGTQYFIVVWRYGTDVPPPDNSSVQLFVDISTPPANETCATAIPLNLNEPVRGSTALGTNDYQIALSCYPSAGHTLSSGPGRDVVYSFLAPNSGNYSFRVNRFDNAVADPILYVTTNCPTRMPSDPNPIQITSCLAVANRAERGTSEEIYCLPILANQLVFIFVDDATNACSVNCSNGFGSSFTITATACVRETETNNSSLTANAPIFGIEGSIDYSGDVDFYSLGTPAAGSRLFSLLDGEAATTTDFIMRVITSNGTVEWDTRDNDQDFGNFSPNVAGTPLNSLPTFIRIDRKANPNEPYRLYTVIQPPFASATREVEPNNSLAEANGGPNNYFYGTLPTNRPPLAATPSRDIDSYQFEADAGDMLFISADADPLRNQTPINLALELLDDSANVLVSVDDGNASSLAQSNQSTNINDYPNSPGEALVYRVAASGTYYARVSIQSTTATGSIGNGDYLLSISRNGIPGGLGRPEEPFIDSVSRLPNGRCQFTVHGTPGVPYRILSSSDLTRWYGGASSARMTSGDGTFVYEDPSTITGVRFYRAVWP